MKTTSRKGCELMKKSLKLTMTQSKYKYLSKTRKMSLLLLILMWSLMGQHIYAGSSAYALATVTVTAAASAEEDFSFNTNGKGKENIAEITATNCVAKATLTSATTSKKYKSNSNTASTTGIYGHINENDNNSNKLPQNVARGDQEQQPNMMYMNIKKPAPSQSQSQSPLQSTSSSISTMSAGATTPEVSQLPPAESLLMPKDQLNETVYNKIPKSHEKDINSDTKPPEDSNETKILKAKYNDAQVGRVAGNSSSNNNVLNTSENDSATESNLRDPTNVLKFDKAKHEVSGNEVDPEYWEKFESFDSVAHARQQLISQVALRLKQIPRVTYFTCKEPSVAIGQPNDNKVNGHANRYKRRTNMNKATVEFVKRMYAGDAPQASGIMMQVVPIDHLANKKYANNSRPLTRGSGFFGTASGPGTSRPYDTGNWLEELLGSAGLRQIIVLDLSCGQASRRILEMASNKALFNSKYHWLLLEDYYAFNRQTEIDDANDTESSSKRNSYSYNSAEADKSFEQEIVNDSNATSLQVKKLFAYPADVVGASTSGSNTTPSPDSPTSRALSSTFSTFKIAAAASHQQQGLVDDKSSAPLNASRAGTTDEDDIEIIEKFLGKLNININTELILAKRDMRAIVPASNVSTTFNMKPTSSRPPPSPPPEPLTNSKSTDSDDYHSLQKMDYYLLYDVWNPGLQYGGLLNVSEIGYLTRTEGLKLSRWYSTTTTTTRRINMHLARVRCLVVVTHKNDSVGLEEYLTSHHDTHLDSMNRFNFALLTYVRDLFNISFILSKTSTWGYLKNGKFDGMIGALVQKQADIGGSPIFYRMERAKVIDYTVRTWEARPCFIFRHPRSTKKDRIVFLQPFSNVVWMILLACSLLVIVLLWLLKRVERKFNFKNDAMRSSMWSANDEQPEISEMQGEGLKRCLLHCVASLRQCFRAFMTNRGCLGLFFESIIFYVGSICQQGLSFPTFYFSGRCIVLTSLLFSFIIYQFYSASIVGTLLMEKPKTIRTLADLIHSSLDIGIEDIAYNRDYFLRTKDPLAQELYAKKVTSVPTTRVAGNADNTADLGASAKAYSDILHSYVTGVPAKTNEASNWYDPDYGVAKIKRGHFAFHVDVATAYKIIADTFSEREICDLAEIQLFPPQKMVGIVQKGSPLRKAITYGLRRVTEIGLTDYQRKIWHSPKPRCIKQLHADDLRVDMQTFTSALSVLIVGYAVSLLILSLEIVHFKLWQRYTALRTSST